MSDKVFVILRKHKRSASIARVFTDKEAAVNYCKNYAENYFCFGANNYYYGDNMKEFLHIKECEVKDV